MDNLSKFLDSFRKGVYISPGSLSSGSSLEFRPLPFKYKTKPDGWVHVGPDETKPWYAAFSIHFVGRDDRGISKSYRCFKPYITEAGVKGVLCPFCAFSSKCMESDSDEVLQVGRDMGRKFKMLVHAINVDTSSICIISLTQQTIANRLADLLSQMPVDPADKINGRNFVLRRTHSRSPSQYYTLDKTDVCPRPPYSGYREDLVAEAYKTELYGGTEDLSKAIKRAIKFLNGLDIGVTLK